MPESELIEEYLAFVDDVLDELGSREEVEYIRQIMKNGTGADRQLRVYEKTGDMKAVMEYIIAETGRPRRRRRRHPPRGQSRVGVAPPAHQGVDAL